jgi:hypothetical protein
VPMPLLLDSRVWNEQPKGVGIRCHDMTIHVNLFRQFHDLHRSVSMIDYLCGASAAAK